MTGIIIQARLGSTRFPEKLIKPFFRDDLLIDIILKKFLAYKNDYSIVLATTVNKHDDRLVEVCAKYPIHIFRGSEEDVMDRFIKASETFKLETIIRVCSDNPFFDVSGTLNLLNFFESKYDYVSYKMDDGRPTIKSHLGFWGEVVSHKALVSAHTLTSDPHYLQHVTNYIYEHPDAFELNLIKSPGSIGEAEHIRLTLDTAKDYELQKEIYGEMNMANIAITPQNILEYINPKPELMRQMKAQIKINSK